MTTQLPERLRELADDAPVVVSAEGLWREGRRRHRRQVVGVLAVVGCLVAGLAAIGVGSWQGVRPGPTTPPVSGSAALLIPDRLYNPSPWTPTARAPGRLVAVMTSTRDHFPFGSDRNAVVGVAAGTQAYRFIDLPGQAADSDVYLSPDGGHLAYWIHGAPRGGSDLGSGSVAGLGVLDLMTGTVERYVVPSPHGLAPVSVTWVDSHTLALVTDVFTTRRPTSYAGRTRTLQLRLGHSDLTRLPDSAVLDIPVTTTGGVFAGMIGKRHLRAYPPAADSFDVNDDLTLSAPVKSVAYDRPHGWVAATRGDVDAGGPTAGALVVGRVLGGRVRLHVVPGGRSYAQVLAWVDRAHVATFRQTHTGLSYDVVDIRTGARRQLTSKPWYAFAIAGDALRRAETVPAIVPPAPRNPRWIALAGLVVVCACGGVVVVRRSRGRV